MSDSIFDTIKSHPMEASVIGGAALLGLCMALFLWQYRQRRASSMTETPTPLQSLLLDCTPFPEVLCSLIRDYALNEKREEVKKILRKYREQLELFSSHPKLGGPAIAGGAGIRVWMYRTILEAFTEDRFYERMTKLVYSADPSVRAVSFCNHIINRAWTRSMSPEKPKDVSTCLIPTNYEEQGEIEYLKTLFLKEQYWVGECSEGLLCFPNAKNYRSMLPAGFIEDLTSVLEGNGLSSNYEEIPAPSARQHGHA